MSGFAGFTREDRDAVVRLLAKQLALIATLLEDQALETCRPCILFPACTERQV